MHLGKLALVVVLALLTTACGYTWRPLHEAKLARRPDLGAVVLFTERGTVALADAKETASGIVGKFDGNRPMLVPRSEIRDGLVYEPVSRPLSGAAIAGIVVGATAGAGLITFGALLAHMQPISFAGW